MLWVYIANVRAYIANVMNAYLGMLENHGKNSPDV